MAGILDFLGLGGAAPQGGVLAGTMNPSMYGPTPGSWQDKAGIFGATLKDVGANLGGHPADADNIAAYRQLQRQMAGQQFMSSLLYPGQQQAGPVDPNATQAPASAPQQPSGTPSGIAPAPNVGSSGPALPQLPPSQPPQGSPQQSASPSSAMPAPSGPQAASDPSEDVSSLTPMQRAFYARIPHIPGMPPQQAISFYATDAGAYQTAWAKRYAPTALQLNANAAYGAGTPGAQAAVRGNVAKGAVVNLRQGGGALNMADGSVVTMPGSNGVQTTFPQGAGGPAVMGMPQGAPQALAASAYATRGGNQAATPFTTAVDANGMPVRTNNLAMTGNPNVLGLPGQNQPAGLPASPPNLPRLGQPRPPGPQASAAPPQPGGLMPALPANQGPYMAGQGKDASDRHDATIAAAEGSPDRVNVLNNIIDLSKGGVNTGPGSEWQNKVLGTLANAPVLGALVSDGTKTNLAKFQEMQKFLLQNGQRAWQAAGGTGTDAQLEAASHANPNDAQFPQALQTITKWVKAGEMAVQGKANAQDNYLAQNGNTAGNQIQFENSWRNAMDRRVFQLQSMSPQEQQAYVKSLSPADAATIRAKRQQLMSMGGIVQ